MEVRYQSATKYEDKYKRNLINQYCKRDINYG